MNGLKFVLLSSVLTALSYSTLVFAQADVSSPAGGHIHSHGAKHVRSDSHAPIGVMAEHPHTKGEWMLSYRFQHMSMEDNLIGDDEVTPEQISTTVPNRFFGIPGQPPTLRVVPTEMSMDMHMLGGMFAATDWLTLMVMGMYIEKSMDHITFMGGAGTVRLGTFTTKSNGFGDTKVIGMFDVYHAGNHRIQLNAGLSFPTGSITEQGAVLTPMGATVNLRLPYPMQLGSGTYDLLPGIHYAGNHDKWSWGAQYTGTLRLSENGENYSLGDKHILTSWASYRWFNWLSTSFRVKGETLESIDGIDTNIVAPVQTADPDNQGGETLSVLFGFNLAGQTGALKGHRLAFEAGFPVYQDLNGPQLETNVVVTFGWQYAF
jgi:hypothetical protein